MSTRYIYQMWTCYFASKTHPVSAACFTNTKLWSSSVPRRVTNDKFRDPCLPPPRWSLGFPGCYFSSLESNVYFRWRGTLTIFKIESRSPATPEKNQDCVRESGEAQVLLDSEKTESPSGIKPIFLSLYLVTFAVTLQQSCSRRSGMLGIQELACSHWPMMYGTLLPAPAPAVTGRSQHGWGSLCCLCHILLSNWLRRAANQTLMGNFSQL